MRGGKKKKAESQPAEFRLPKDAIQRIIIGQAHAEYDKIRKDKTLVVRTPALDAALDGNRSKCFFVGKRGTGKTSIAYYLKNTKRNVIDLIPMIFNALSEHLNTDDLKDPRQRYFASLVSCFQRALIDEVYSDWISSGKVTYNNLPSELVSERNYIEDNTFDTRMFAFAESILYAIKKHQDRAWIKHKFRARDVGKAMELVHADHPWDEYLVLIDRIDDSWDGSDGAILLLMAMMQACIDLSSEYTFIRPLLFLRENIFERIREINPEFSRMETSVVSLDWTREMLLEMIERRVQNGLNPKPPMGQVWDVVFEKKDGKSSHSVVFDYCQERPRDIIIYCNYAVEMAQSKRHQIVSLEDLISVRRKFSANRLKEIGDEYSENYPQIQLLLNRFYGLSTEYTLNAINAFIQKVIIDREIAELCKGWIFKHTAPHKFIELLYGIGFVGIKNGQATEYRGSGARASRVPAIMATTHIVIHPTYSEALNLQEKILGAINEDFDLQVEGLLLDLPGAIDPTDYANKLANLINELSLTPPGLDDAPAYEKIVGEMVRLCFYRTLSNVKPHERDIDGKVVRDWIASNVAQTGFWNMVKDLYGANQIVWECKNFTDLESPVFHQTNYYMNDTIGKFAIICFRGEIKKSYYYHIKRIKTNFGGMVLLMDDSDLKTFMRQAMNGKVKENHIQDKYDTTIRLIS